MAREKSETKIGARKRLPRGWAPTRVNARFRALVERAFDAVALCSADGTLLYVSPNSRHVWGYDPQEMIGCKGADYLHPDDVQHWTRMRTDLLRDPGRRVKAEMRVRHGNGTWRWVEGSACSWLDDPGVRAIVVNFHDVTERKRAEARLTVQYAVTAVLAASASLAEASPKLLQAICEGVEWDLAELWHVDAASNVLCLDGVWHVPALNVAHFVALSRATTFAPGSGVPGRVWQGGEALWINDLAAEPSVRAAAAAQLGLHSAVAMPIHCGNHVTGVMMFVARDIRQPDDDVLHLLEAVGRQISVFIERKRSEAEVFPLAALVASSDDAILGVTLDGIVMSWNGGAERMYGYTAAEVVGRPVAVVLPSERAQELDNILGRIRHGERIDHYETVRVRKDGTHIDVSLSVSAIKDVAGRIIGASSIARDITERQRAAAQVRELQKLAQQRERLADIGAITAEIAHDLGNPLAGISMQAQLILRRAQRDETQPISAAVPAMQRIVAETRRLSSLIKEFMEFSREQRLDLNAVDLHRFLRDVVGLWEPVAAARAMTLILDAPRNVPAVTADEEKLRRVFDNLVKNAIEAIDHGPGQVVIQVTRAAPEAVRISVSDTGPGIGDTVQVFRLFETTKPHGSGIGLAVARQIVLAHRGRIDCARLDPYGTVFRVELPCNTPASGARAPMAQVR